MKNVLFVLPALALICLAAPAQADDGAIDSATLSAMGLGGVQVMTDSQADEVRGMGYQRPRPRRSLALAFGASYSYIEGSGYDISGSSGSLDGFLSYGNHYAAGDHFSKTVATKETTETTVIGGIPVFSSTHTTTISIGSLGGSSSIAF